MKSPIKELIKNKTGVDLSEKGFVLILALVAMLAMTIIGISLVMNMSTDMHLAKNEEESKQAFQLAEAGINETVARLRLATTHAKYVGEPAAAAGTYRTVAGWAGASFNSGTSADGLDYDVNIAYLTEQDVFRDSAACSGAGIRNFDIGGGCVGGMPATAGFDGEVVMYGQDFNICSSANACVGAPATPSAKFGSYPVYMITSTGHQNTTDRTIEAYVGASDLNIDTLGAINTNNCVIVNGGGDITGGAGVGAVQGAGCACDASITGAPACQTKAASDDMNTFLNGGAMAELAASADYQIACATMNECNAAIGAVPDDMWGDCAGDTTSKLIYIRETAGALTPDPSISGIDLGAGACGRGILIVEGNVTFAGGFKWEGLVYVIGTLTFSGGGGGVNIEGGVMANNSVTVSGGIVADYDRATLETVGRQVGSGAKTFIMWRRI